MPPRIQHGPSATSSTTTTAGGPWSSFVETFSRSQHSDDADDQYQSPDSGSPTIGNLKDGQRRLRRHPERRSTAQEPALHTHCSLWSVCALQDASGRPRYLRWKGPTTRSFAHAVSLFGRPPLQRSGTMACMSRAWAWFRSACARVRNTALRLTLAAAGAAAVCLLLLWLPPWLVDQAHGQLSDTDRIKAVTEERRTVLAGLAAIGAAVTLWYTHQRQALDRDANRTDRYTKAVEQLGDDSKPSVQLGGVYALERVAHDSPRDHAVGVEVLSAFVRQQSKMRPAGSDVIGRWEGDHSPDAPNPRVDPAGPPSEPVLAALSVLARRPRGDETSPNLRGAYLTGADLPGANLHGANLADADLSRANLTRADLTEANLSGATLTGANLSAADLSRANLCRADLTDADLAYSNLTRTLLVDANLTDADLRGAMLTGATLMAATLTRADVTGAFMPQGWQRPSGDQAPFGGPADAWDAQPRNYGPGS
jgi:Pentapeptide repeats (8 copies)